MSVCRPAFSLALLAAALTLCGCGRFSRQSSKNASKPGPAGSAAKHEEPKRETLGPPIDSANVMASEIFRRTASTGLVAVVVREDETWMGGFGQVSPGSNQTPQADSLLRLCSISKILATDLLSKMVAANKMALDDPLQKYAPAGVTVPTRTVRGDTERPVELLDLATHTAGMPREIAYPPQGAAHFTFPDFDYRWQWVPGFRLRVTPGSAAHYSNIGFDLLGDAIAQANGESYQKVFERETAAPLHLQETTLEPSPEQCSRLMGGAREPSECTDTEAAAGSGGMYSSARDMERVLRYFLSLPGVSAHANSMATGMIIDPANLKSIQGLGHAGLPSALGLGWIEINAPYGPSRIVEKTGGGAGFQTYIALNPARHAGVFFARTAGRHGGGANMFREANDMLLAMVGLPPVPSDPGDPERELTAAELAEAHAKQRGIRHTASARPSKGTRAAAPASKAAPIVSSRRQAATTRKAATGKTAVKARGVKRVVKAPTASKPRRKAR